MRFLRRCLLHQRKSSGSHMLIWKLAMLESNMCVCCIDWKNSSDAGAFSSTSQAECSMPAAAEGQKFSESSGQLYQLQQRELCSPCFSLAHFGKNVAYSIIKKEIELIVYAAGIKLMEPLTL